LILDNKEIEIKLMGMILRDKFIIVRSDLCDDCFVKLGMIGRELNLEDVNEVGVIRNIGTK
jgi:hypothetical protein